MHIDDIMILAENEQLIKLFKNQIKQYVNYTDGNEIHWLLGIEILRDTQARTISLR